MVSLWSLKLSKDQIRGIFQPNWKKGVQLKSASLVFSCISAKINATRFYLRISIFLCTFTKFFNPFYNLANSPSPPQISKSQYIYFPHWFRQNEVIKLKNMEPPLSYNDKSKKLDLQNQHSTYIPNSSLVFQINC